MRDHQRTAPPITTGADPQGDAEQMQTLTDLAVGDRVVCRDVNEHHSSRHRGPDWTPPIAEVVKIGRTLLHVVPVENLHQYHAALAKPDADRRAADWYVRKYRIDGGHGTGDWGDQVWIQTPEQYDDEAACKALLAHLRGAGVTITGPASKALTSQQLGAILAIVRPDEDDDPS